MSNYSSNLNVVNSRNSSQREAPQLQPVQYGEVINQVPLRPPNGWGEENTTNISLSAIKSEFSANSPTPTTTNDFYTIDQRAYASKVKNEVENPCYDDKSSLKAIIPWVSNQMGENDVHFFVPTQKCKIEPNDIRTIYNCCNIKFYDKFLHFRHMIDHMEEQLTSVIQCYYCNHTFRSETDMIRHAKSVHIGFTCRFCSLILPKKYLLVRHLAEVHRYKPKRHENMCHSNRYQWTRSHTSKHISKKNKDIFSAKYKWKSSDVKKEPKCNIKPEPIHSNVKTEPTYSNIKTEPTYSNIKMEPTHSNIKIEPTYSNYEMGLRNVKKEPTLVNIKREPTDWNQHC